MEEFEEELRREFERRPAPPSLKRKVMERARLRKARTPLVHAAWWQRLAAAVALAAVLGGAAIWRQAEERRRGEEARAQVFTALRITGRALNTMNSRLAAHGRAQE
jgi:hypothetical protein